MTYLVHTDMTSLPVTTKPSRKLPLSDSRPRRTSHATRDILDSSPQHSAHGSAHPDPPSLGEPSLESLTERCARVVRVFGRNSCEKERSRSEITAAGFSREPSVSLEKLQIARIVHFNNGLMAGRCRSQSSHYSL
jgi:hypothetical protein